MMQFTQMMVQTAHKKRTISFFFALRSQELHEGERLQTGLLGLKMTDLRKQTKRKKSPSSSTDRQFQED